MSLTDHQVEDRITKLQHLQLLNHDGMLSCVDCICVLIEVDNLEDLALVCAHKNNIISDSINCLDLRINCNLSPLAGIPRQEEGEE